jgi:hypothetical protein
MDGESTGLVLFGDVVGSSRDRVGTTAWLRGLVAELDEAYGEKRLGRFAFTQGDELQGLLVPGANPMHAVLRAALGLDGRRVRWAVVQGDIDEDIGEGFSPATERTGPAFWAARQAIEEARSRHDRFVIDTARKEADALLEDMAPALFEMLDVMTPRARLVARYALVEGLRQSEVAERLAVRRATISVSFARAGIVPVQRLVAAMNRIYGATDAAGEDVDDLDW